jgi:hypothetical protein
MAEKFFVRGWFRGRNYPLAVAHGDGSPKAGQGLGHFGLDEYAGRLVRTRQDTVRTPGPAADRTGTEARNNNLNGWGDLSGCGGDGGFRRPSVIQKPDRLGAAGKPRRTGRSTAAN